jgi:hypothetical protein
LKGKLMHDPRTPAPLGPSDSSDTASDLIGAEDWRPEGNPPAAGPRGLEAATDAEGTGERASAIGDTEVADGADIGVDRIIEAEEAGLGGGFDQAEEAQLAEPDASVPPAPGVGDDR